MKCSKCGATLTASVLVADVRPHTTYHSAYGNRAQAACQHEPEGGTLVVLSAQELGKALTWAYFAMVREVGTRKAQSLVDYLEDSSALPAHAWMRREPLYGVLHAWAEAMDAPRAREEAHDARQ